MNDWKTRTDRVLGKHAEGFSEFLGRYVATQVIVGCILKVAMNIVVLYIMGHLFCKTTN